MRMWAKKLVRLAAASRAACQGGSSSSNMVCQAKASRLRAAFVERFVRGRLAGEDEIVAGVRHHLADGMTGEQIVAEIDRAQRRDPSVVTVEPAFDGVVAMNRRFTLSSQSCFSAPSWMTTNSGIRGTTLEWLGVPRQWPTAGNDSYLFCRWSARG